MYDFIGKNSARASQTRSVVTPRLKTGVYVSTTHQAVSGFAIAELRSPVALAKPGAADQLDVARSRRDVDVAPPVVAPARVLARGAVVFSWAVAVLDAQSQRRRVHRIQNCRVYRRFQEAVGVRSLTNISD